MQKELGFEQLPWEQNQQSLHINTQAENIEDTPSIQEQSQVKMDAEKCNSRSTKIRTSIAENSQSDNPANSENRRECILNVNTSKEIIKTSISEKKETALFINLENDKDSSNFRDMSSPDIIENYGHLKGITDKKNDPEIDNSGKTKRKNEEKDINDVPNKKLKIYNLNQVQDIDEDQADKDVSVSILNTCVKSSYSRSPSLFDDSLNLDTQMYDILEQNVIDLSGLEDSNAFESKLHTVNMLQEKSANPNGNLQTDNENNSNARILVNMAHLPKNSVLSWDDDSWNDFAELSKKTVENNAQNTKKEISQCKIVDIVNTGASLAPRNAKACIQNKKEDLRDTGDKKRTTVTVKEKAPQKAKLLKIASAQSPVGNVIVFRDERKISVDSSRSDSDDVFFASQLFESTFSNNKSRTKTQLEKKIHKMCSHKLAENTEKPNNYINSSIEEKSSGAVKDSAKKKVKLKLKEILPRKKDFGTGSVIYDSEDEIAAESKPVLRVRRHETQLSVSKEKVKPKIEIVPRSDNNVDMLSETIDWNTLNIVKVANNRTTFSLFKREVLKKRSFALALHCDTHTDNNIGSKICVTDAKKKRKLRKSMNYTYGRKEIRGAAISWESNIAYYISFNNAQGKRNKNLSR